MKSSTNNLAMVNRVPIRLTHSPFRNSRLNKFFDKYLSSPSPTRSYTLREFERLQSRVCHDVGPMRINFKCNPLYTGRPILNECSYQPGICDFNRSSVTYICI